jgi:mannose-1-phosphate guanylyltransferase/phosphomannomutase
VFPDVVPGYDAVGSLCKLLELLVIADQPVSALVAELPVPSLVHRSLPCPWARKGLVMRLLNERLADRELDLLDGIKAFDDRGWVQVLPDPDEPLVHLYAEATNGADSGELADELQRQIELIVQGDGVPARTGEKASS